MKKGKVVEIPGVGTIPPASSFAMGGGDPEEHIDRIVKELFEVKGAVMSLENQAAFKWRALFTSKKTVGLSPIDGRKGDIIFAIFGCDVPFLVRKTEKGYLFLGEWWVCLSYIASRFANIQKLCSWFHGWSHNASVRPRRFEAGSFESGVSAVTSVGCAIP